MKRLVCICFVVLCLVASGGVDGLSATAADFPSKPVELCIGMAAGGGLYHMMRVVAAKAGEILGQPVLVVAKPGAGGTIAADFVHRAKPDGYTLLGVIPGKVADGNYLLSKVGYRNTDFEYFGMFGYNETFLYVMSSRPWKTLEEFVDYARKHPDELKYPTISTGTHIMMEKLCKDTGIKMIRIPMKGEAECISAMVGGHVDVSIGWPTSVLSLREGGKIQVLATFNEDRSKFLPEVPSLKEKGYPEVCLTRASFYGVAGPKGIPKDISAKLRESLQKAFQDKEVRASLEKLWVIPKYLPGEQFEKLVFQMEKGARKLYTEFGYKIENE